MENTLPQQIDKVTTTTMQEDTKAANELANRFKKNFRAGTLRYKISAFYLGYPLELRDRVQRMTLPEFDPPQKFVIFTSGRSGSTLLVDLINSNPNIHCDLELLKRRVFAPMSLIRTHAKCSTQDTYGFKLLSYQLKNVQTGIRNKWMFLDRLVNKKGYKLIHLERENKAKQALSIIYAFYRGKWHNQKGSQQKQSLQFELEPKVLYKFIKESEILRQFETEMLQGQEYLHVSYEKDLANADRRAATIQNVSDWIGVDAVHPETSLRKVTPSKLSTMISNKQEVIDFIANTDCAHYVPTLEKM
ncbi:MAG: hypothetical protein AAF738_06220 [Bacteroidota bacterium]